MSKQSESYQQEKQLPAKRPRMSKELEAELVSLSMANEIDMRGMPEKLDWKNAVIGKYYRPVKHPVSIRLDADIIDWFKGHGKGYQSRINEVLRAHLRVASAGAQVTSTKKSGAAKGSSIRSKSARQK